MSDEQTPLSAAGWTLSIGAAGADSTAAKGFHAIYRGESLGAPIRGVLAVISHGGGGRNRSPRCDPICRSGSIMSLVPPSRSIAPIEANLTKYGLDRRCAKVRACEVPVLALDDPASGAREKLSAEIARALREDHCDAIVLGCAGMADLAAALAREHGAPVIYGVAAAVKLVEALSALGLATSKLGPYAPPLPKRFTGMFAPMGSR